MNNLLCHPGRIFTLDELDDQAKAAPESMPRELNESLEDGDTLVGAASSITA
jgi:hypothetical protein